MSPDDSINLDRLAAAFDKIATALTEFVIIERERFNKQYPKERPRRAAEINIRESERKEQYSDKPSPEWLEETEEALPPSRFQKRFDRQTAESKSAKKSRSNSQVV